MSGLELAVVALAVLSCLALVGVAASLLQVRTLRETLAREPRRLPAREPSREIRTVRAVGESDAGVRFLPSVVAETSLSRERELPAERQLSAPSNQQVVPLIRVVAVAHGVRCALAQANRDRIRALVRRDIRRRHKLRLRAARRAARVVPVDADS